MRSPIWLCLVAVLAAAAPAAAQPRTFTFSGHIDSVIDANVSVDQIAFPPIPVGSTFTGSFTYDPSAPQTGGGNGYKLYYNLAPSGMGSVTANGMTFSTVPNPAAANPLIALYSAEAGFGISGLDFSTQPVTLPSGWTADYPEYPYFTLQLFNQNPPTTQSLALPLT